LSIPGADDHPTERIECIKNARGGGSITPAYNKILQGHITSGRVVLHTLTTIHSRLFDVERKQWDVTLATSAPRPTKLPPPSSTASCLCGIDFLYFATGIQTNIDALPFLRSMQADYPITAHGGLPCLNEDLMWKDNVPLFFTGRMAALRLGPGAANLGGARVGAERIAWSIGEMLASKKKRKELDDHGVRVGHVGEDGNHDVDERRREYASGRRNRYAQLVEDEQ
jgi:hypothetical protein